MGRVNRHTPLAQLTAVVLDSETTGLDVASVRLLQIGAVRVEAGRVLADQTFDVLVNPGVPIPPRSTAVHGIDDAAVQTAPTFAAIRPQLDRFLGDAVIVGQSIGFDLAVLLHETQRIGEEWRPPHYLDTKLLAAALDPEAREFGLDALAERFAVSIAARHSALADAQATAEIFVRMLPILAEAGIRTLADAEAHSNAQVRIRARQRAEGWYDGAASSDAFESGREAAALGRLDTFLYRHRAHHVMTRPVIVSPTTPLREAVRLMAELDLPAVLAGDEAQGRADGIVCQRDVVRVIARDADALDGRIERVMSEPVLTLPREAFLYRALARMQRLGVQHLAVSDAAQRVVGLLSLSDLVANQAADALVLGDELAGARSPHDLSVAFGKLPIVTRHLLADRVDPHEIAVVVSVEMHELLGRAAAQAERRMAAQGDGSAPVPYALLALGRGGRSECLLVAETAHAIVFESDDADGAETRWFAAFAAHLHDVLDEAGIAPQIGARQAQWRRSLADWREALDGWARTPPADHAAALFLDAAFIYGDAELGAELRDMARVRAAMSPQLVRSLLPADASSGPPHGRIDLDAAGLAPIEAAARCLTVAVGAAPHTTAERLAHAVAGASWSWALADELIEAHQVLVRAALEQQHADVADNIAPSFLLDVERLIEPRRRELLAALGRAEGLRDLVSAALPTG